MVKLVITHLQEIAFTRNMQSPKTLFNIEGLFGDMLLMTRIVVEHFILSSMFMYILVENCQLVRITGLRYGYQILMVSKVVSIEGKYYSRKERRRIWAFQDLPQ